MRRVLVTGANKGIGFAIVEAILNEHSDAFVYLGSRDRARGDEARAKLGDRASRVEVLALDVTSDASAQAAAKNVLPLYAIVNNAGIGSGNTLEATLGTNVLGIRHVCDAFLPKLDPNGGRIVNITSAAGPTFVSKCSEEKQRFFLDAETRSMSWETLRAFVDECIAMGDDKAKFAAKGLSDGAPYGLSKACANALTLILAREHPNLRVNACTPGFIETDLTKPYVESSKKSAKELGMKSPAEGARAPMHLLWDELEGNGRYYGSDAKRSPLDRYREPGSPPYVGP
jgi:NAD(P)-dependent dehydrogenase (short-subunit alcohol dehydrogenase family)